MQIVARRMVRVGVVVASLAASVALFAQDKAPSPPQALGADRLAAIDRISSDSLKGHLSFLASDLLEGRDTPSKGLDLAAEYIAAQFRRAGLEPVGDDGYFQTANWELSEPAPASFGLMVSKEPAPFVIDASMVSLTGTRPFRFADLPVFKVDFKAWEGLKPEDVEGKAVLVEMPDASKAARADRMNILAANNRFRTKMAELKASVVIGVSRNLDAAGLGNSRLIDPEGPPTRDRPGLDAGGITTITVHNPAIARFFDENADGPIAAKVSTSLGDPVRRPVKLRNVVGLLRGSDPMLKETCVMVTSHYDHIGVRGPEGTDRIFNGANDDGSGTVSVVEIASALATLKERPRRSILFVTFFGEEKGLLGSRYYGKHPIFPIEKTMADVNLEQVGRTDDTEGPQVNRASLTGFGYSGVSTAFVQSGEAEGVAVVKHPRNSDAFFGRSDNQALADLGVPAHTLCVAFQYPDYHGAADHWDKVDYANMARIDRMVARALLTLADDPEEPKWDESNPKAAKYWKAWKDRRGQ